MLEKKLRMNESEENEGDRERKSEKDVVRHEV